MKTIAVSHNMTDLRDYIQIPRHMYPDTDEGYDAFISAEEREADLVRDLVETILTEQLAAAFPGVDITVKIETHDDAGNGDTTVVVDGEQDEDDAYGIGDLIGRIYNHEYGIIGTPVE